MLWVSFPMAAFLFFPAGIARGFLSSLHRENLVQVPMVKLTKGGTPEVLTFQLVHTEPPAICP